LQCSQVKVPGARMNGRAVVALNRQGGHAVPGEKCGGGQPHQAAADDKDVGFDHHARPGFGPIRVLSSPSEAVGKTGFPFFRSCERSLVEHDLSGKPASTFPDHALHTRATLMGQPRYSGEVAEWLNAPHSKCGIRATVSGVRIPPSPPCHMARLLIGLTNLYS